MKHYLPESFDSGMTLRVPIAILDIILQLIHINPGGLQASDQHLELLLIEQLQPAGGDDGLQAPQECIGHRLHLHIQAEVGREQDVVCFICICDWLVPPSRNQLYLSK